VFELCGAEVQEQPASQFRRSKIVDDLRMVCGPGHRPRFDLQDDLLEAHKVDSMLAAQWTTFVFHRARDFRAKWNTAISELEGERVFVKQFKIPSA
jgi:hypothetical protein